MTNTTQIQYLSNSPNQQCQDKAYKILVADLVGLTFDAHGLPDHSQVRAHIKKLGGQFYLSGVDPRKAYAPGRLHFFYQPNLSTAEQILACTCDGQYDAVIAAATCIPANACFNYGGVRIGAGTGNMASSSWAGSNGAHGLAPLMNTPGVNAQATAQMAIKALLTVCPDLPVAHMHDKILAGQFDTAKQLRDYPTQKLASKRIALLGYGNIGREMAKLASAFGMTVVIYARPCHQQWIESEGFVFAPTPVDAARCADIISVHTGLGAFDASTQGYSNAGLIDASVLRVMNPGAIVINYDRGELVDVAALDQALIDGKVSHAFIDADLFVDEQSGELSGPMLPYRAIQPRHSNKMFLLPHAADTEHCSRVQGAMQAVDQIYAAIQQRLIINLVGELPPGYTDDGVRITKGIGKVRPQNIVDVADTADALQGLTLMSTQMQTFWASMSALTEQEQRLALAKHDGAQLMLNINRYIVALEALGLRGPFTSHN